MSLQAPLLSRVERAIKSRLNGIVALRGVGLSFLVLRSLKLPNSTLETATLNQGF